jgi:GDP-4-dehydro-6-deoxy-D-mannose reductase
LTRTLLLIGADGFAGRHFRRAAEEGGFDVAPATRNGDGLRVDLLERSTIDAALAEAEPDLVVNLAGSASVAASFGDPAAAFAVNALGTVNLLAAVGAGRPGSHVLCVSSGEVYGLPESGDLPFTEDAPPRPLSPYGASKAAMEVVCGQHARGEGLRVAVMRAFNHTGPGQSATFAASSFARQVAEAEARGEDRLALRTGNVDVERDFSDVRDVAAAYGRACDSELEGTFNVCSGRPSPVRSIIDHLAAASALELTVEVDPARVRDGEAPQVYGSHDRLTEATGWKPEIPLERTVADLLDWWRERAEGTGH